MKRLAVYDDREARKGNDVRADETLYLGLNGTWREIDLTDPNAAELREAIREFWDAGRKVDRAPTGLAHGMGQPPARAPGVSYPAGWTARRYWSEFRSWCDAQNPRRTYRAPSGFSPKKQDVADFDTYIAGFHKYIAGQASGGSQPGDSRPGGRPAA